MYFLCIGMTLELNDVLLSGEPRTLSMMAAEGQVTCLAGGTAERRVRWLYAMMGFVPVRSGFINIDGEPLDAATVDYFRRMMAFAPQALLPEGRVQVYEPPTVQDVFALKSNRHLPISNGILAEEVRRTGIAGPQAQLLAVAVLLSKPILLIENPVPESLPYIRQQASAGKIVVVASDRHEVLGASDQVVEMVQA